MQHPEGKGRRLLHWAANYPWPVGQQDYVLQQYFHSEHSSQGGLLRCLQSSSLPEAEARHLCACQKGATRIYDYRSHLAIWPAENESRSSFAMLIFNGTAQSFNF